MNNIILKLVILGITLLFYSFNKKNKLEGETNQERQLTISAKKMNILYVGMENPLDIAITNENNENKITVTIDNGTISKRQGIEWVANIYKPGKTTIHVYLEKDGVKKLFGTKEFRAFRVPEPLPKILGSKDIFIDKQTILQNPNLEIVLDNFPFDDNFFKVISFTFLYSNKNSTKEFMCTENKINKDAIEVIKKSTLDDFLTFKEIKILGPDEKVRIFPPIFLRIK